MRPDVAVIWMTSASTVYFALEALRFGASDYLIKPFSAEELSAVLRRQAERRTLDIASRGLASGCARAGGRAHLGESPEMEKLYRILARVAQTVHPVLILGRAGRARSWWRARSTAMARAPASLSFRWIAVRWRRR